MKLSAALLSIVLVASSFTIMAKWLTYENQEAKISIKFPAEYVESTTEQDKATTYKAQLQNDKMLFLASSSVHENSVENDIDGLLETSIESFGESLNASLVSVKPIKLKRVRGSLATFNFGAGNAKIEYRVFLNGNLQYQVITAQLGTEYDQEIADKFYKSFKILK